ncbi:MAG: GerMN domain-containing protein [Chloroflexota bacterium]|nr:GerMN domain-containing protein [Chloroflexota bacterium]
MTDERRDDEIIGRALSRAIETIDVNQTPYERSRIATAPARRSIFGVWQIATAAAAIVLALAIGSWFTRPTEGQPGVAASPSATPLSPDATPSPTSTPSTPTSLVPARIYFARDGLPPVGVSVPRADLPTAEERIALRIGTLLQEGAALTGPAAPPPGAFNAIPGQPNAHVYTPVPELGAVKVNGDLATVDFKVAGGDWQVRGSAQTAAILQQLVYTATEEPGIGRVLITVNGGQQAKIDQLVLNTPLTREDVFGYSFAAKLGASGGIADGGNIAARYQLGITTSVDTLAPGLARVVLTFRSPQGQDVADLPEFTAWLDHTDSATSQNSAKYWLSVQLGAAEIASTNAEAVVDRTPLRFVRLLGRSVTVGLDDARPWRLFTLSNPARIVIDIGGPTQAVSDRIAVYQPRPGATVTRDLQLTGAARVFEASVSWRLKDSSGREAASGHFLASLGSSAVWGTFDTRIAIPASVSGTVTLEVFEASAKDGSPLGVVAIPLAVR